MLPKIIVSLTTYPARLWCLPQVFEALLHQTVKPDEIQLWVTREEFDDANRSYLEQLNSFTELGISIKWCGENLKPHNKYYWAMKSNPDDVLITVDDDIIYPLTLVQNLLDAHCRHPEAVISCRSHIIRVDEQGGIAPYHRWIFGQNSYFETPRHDLLATGVGGVLYPPRVFSEELFDVESIKATCLLADDLWLLAHELRQDIPIVNTAFTYQLVYVPESQTSGLYLENLDNNRNDTILQALYNHFPGLEQSLKETAAQNVIVEAAPVTEQEPAPSAETAPEAKPSLLRRAVRKIRRTVRRHG